jgi:hypothetical protein
MAPPSDPDFDPENGPEQYLDQDDVGSLRDSYRIQSFRGRVSSRLDVTADATRLTRRCTAANTNRRVKFVKEFEALT